jgi:hypothetical protein
MTCRVHLEDVHGRTLGYRDAGLALPARIRSWPLLAVQGLGENSRCRCLTRSSRAGEEVCVGDPVLRYCVR